MRFAIVLAGIAALCGAGYLYLQQMGIDTKGTTISQSITLAFVRRTMFRIADAEHEQLTVYTDCLPMDQLISAGKIDPEDQERSGYSFAISCEEGDSGFTLTATHAPAPADSPLHWPGLVIDQSMVFREVN
jgi:hypothetical protein